MKMAIHDDDGVRSEAVLLAASDDRLRVVIQGRDDTEEWTNVGGAWRNERGGMVAIEAALCINGIGYSHFCTETWRSMDRGTPRGR